MGRLVTQRFRPHYGCPAAPESLDRRPGTGRSPRFTWIYMVKVDSTPHGQANLVNYMLIGILPT